MLTFSLAARSGHGHFILCFMSVLAGLSLPQQAEPVCLTHHLHEAAAPSSLVLLVTNFNIIYISLEPNRNMADLSDIQQGPRYCT